MGLYESDHPDVARMKGLHLFHFVLSNCSQRVRLGLEEKGLAESEMRNAPKGEVSRSRRYFGVTKSGIDLLRESRRRLTNLWEGLDPVLETNE